MASSIIDRLPLEIWLRILAYLSPPNICRLRMISRAWNERLISDTVVDAMLRRAGFMRRFRQDEELERKMRMQMLRGHAMGKAVAYSTVLLGQQHHSQTGIFRLLNDRLIFNSRQTSTELGIFDVSKGVVEGSTHISGHLSDAFLTERLYGGYDNTAESLFWQEHGAESVERISLPRPLFPFAAAGKIIAGLDYRGSSNYSHAVWLLDTQSQSWKNFPVDLETGYKYDFNCGFSMDDKFVTVFFLYAELSYRLVVKRYSYDGMFLFEKKIPFKTQEPFGIGHLHNSLENSPDNPLEISCLRSSLDGGQYEITSGLGRILYVDVGNETIVKLPEGLTFSWNRYIYSFEDKALCSFQVDDGVLKRKNVLDWTGSGVHQAAVNDRWMCVLTSKDENTYIEVFDFAKE